jgi:enoyl-[acyl-carrier-protein] reductase (NADH)
MQVDLAGRIALLAGQDNVAASAIASALASMGARVVDMQDRTPANAVADTFQEFGRLDILVTCAIDDAHTAKELIQAANPRMVTAGGGRIVTVVSVSGLVPLRAEPAQAVVQSSLVMLTRALALELAAGGVLINAIAAGAVQNSGTAVETNDRMLSHIPLGRAGMPQEIAEAVLFLVDPESTYVTGHVLTVDGGWSVGFGRDF